MKKILIIKNSICVLAFALFAFTITSCVGSGSGNDGTKSTTQNVITTDPKCFNFDINTNTITGLRNDAECDISHIVIPTTIDGFKVKEIGNSAFNGNKALETVDMSEVTNIGNNAFRDNTALTTAKMPNVTNIGDAAFFGNTSLTTVTMSEVTTIGPGAFRGTALTEVTMPLVITIEYDAFRDNTALTTAKMPKAITIGNETFQGKTYVRM